MFAEHSFRFSLNIASDPLAYCITATIINDALKSYRGNSWNSCRILVHANVFGKDHGSRIRDPPCCTMRPANTFVKYVHTIQKLHDNLGG
jgi:hypothetical protein